MAKYNNDNLREFMAVAKALSDENRVRALMFLGGGELCVCQIVEMLGLAPSTVSRHMSILHRAGLVESRKDGRWIHYRLGRAGASSAVREAIRWIRRSLEDDSRIVEDEKRLKAVRKMDRQKLCSSQARE